MVEPQGSSQPAGAAVLKIAPALSEDQLWNESSDAAGAIFEPAAPIGWEVP